MAQAPKTTAKSATISAEDVEFDEAGRAFISNPDAIAALRGVTLGTEAIKNIGCCSSALEGGRAINPQELNALMKDAIKNIGCCSAV